MSATFIHNDKLLSYKELLEKDGLDLLIIKSFKTLPLRFFRRNMASLLKLTNVFTQTTQQQNFHQDFRIPSLDTVYHVSESIFHLGPKIWETVPVKKENKPTVSNSLNSFKKQIRKLVPQNLTFQNFQAIYN